MPSYSLMSAPVCNRWLISCRVTPATRRSRRRTSPLLRSAISASTCSTVLPRSATGGLSQDSIETHPLQGLARGGVRERGLIGAPVVELELEHALAHGELVHHQLPAVAVMTGDHAGHGLLV